MVLRLSDSRQALGGLPSIAVRRNVPGVDVSGLRQGSEALSAGIENLGQTGSKAAYVVNAGWQDAKKAAADSSYLQFQYDENRRLEEFKKNLTPENAEGAANRFFAGFKERNKAFLDSLDPSIRPTYGDKTFEFGDRLMNSEGGAWDAERVGQNMFIANSVEKGMSGSLLPRAQKAASLDPEQRDAELLAIENDAAALIAGTPFGSEMERYEANVEARERVQKMYAESLPAADRANIMEQAERLDSVQAEDLASIAQRGVVDVEEEQAEALKRQKDEREAVFEDRKYKVETGEYAEADLLKDIQDGMLVDGDHINTLRDRIKEYEEETLSYSRAAAKFADTNYSFNTFSNDDQKAVDLLYEKGPLQGGAGLLEADGNQTVGLRQIVTRTGMMPGKAKEMLLSGMWGRDPQARDNAITILDGLYRENPQLIERTLSKADLDRLQDYQALAPLLPPEELAQRMNPGLNPQETERRNKLRAEGRKLAEDIDTSDILSAFDPSWMPFDQPDTSPDPGTVVALRDDFERLFAERYSVTGQEDVARTQAMERLAGKWGATSVGTTDILIQYPPEHYYPPVNGSYDWIDEQLDTYIQESYPDAQAWFPVSTPETDAAVSMIRSGSMVPVPYAIGIINGEGALDIVSNVTFDYESARAVEVERFMQERSEALEPPPSISDTEFGTGLPLQ